MVNVLAWVIFGAVVGWVGSIIMRKSDDINYTSDVLAGIIGALIGGAIARAITSESSQFSVSSLVIAILGSALLIAIIRMFNDDTTARS